MQNLWWQGLEPLKINTLRDNSSKKSLVARLQANPKSFSWNNIHSKCSGGEAANISKQALFEHYNFKMPWWRGGEQVLTQDLETYHLKNLDGWVASISKLAFFKEYEFKIPWWRGGEPFLTLALKYHPWKIIGGEVASTSKQTLFNWIWIRNSLVARLRAINDTSFEK